MLIIKNNICEMKNEGQLSIEKYTMKCEKIKKLTDP